MIKVCGITNVDDALAAVEAGATALGYNFYLRSPRYVTPDAAAAITERLPCRVLHVGVFVNEPSASVARIASTVGLDVAQLHGDEAAADCKVLPRVWKAIGVKPGFAPERLDGYPVEAFLLDTPAGGAYGGTGQTFDWSLIRASGARIVLAGGLGPDNIRMAIRTVRPWGVDACSRLERAPGRKDHQRMREFVQAALEEFYDRDAT